MIVDVQNGFSARISSPHSYVFMCFFWYHTFTEHERRRRRRRRTKGGNSDALTTILEHNWHKWDARELGMKIEGGGAGWKGGLGYRVAIWVCRPYRGCSSCSPYRDSHSTRLCIHRQATHVSYHWWRHACMHAYIHACIHVHIHAYMLVRAHMSQALWESAIDSLDAQHPSLMSHLGAQIGTMNSTLGYSFAT